MPNISFLDKSCNKIDVSSSPVTREKLLMYALLKYYKKTNTIEEIVPIIERKSNISLRIIDWFINSYSKENSLALPIYNKKGKLKNHCYIWNSYKNTLRSFHGEYFEIYKRSDLITLEYNQNKKLDTTLAQLNFFKWALEHNIISYIKNNFNLLGSQLYTSDRKYIKITKKEDENDVELSIKWE
jgi:hypothetical protein